MATITLQLQEAGGDLPSLCMRCGAPATVFKDHTFFLGPLGLPLLILPNVVVATGRIFVKVPLCAAHQFHWGRRTVIILFGFAAFTILTCGGFASLTEATSQVQGRVSSLVSLAGLLGLVLWLVLTILLQKCAIRLASYTDRSLTQAAMAHRV